MSKKLRGGIWLGVALLLALCVLFAALAIRQDRADELAHAADMSHIVATSLEDQATATLRDVTNGLYSAANGVQAEGGLATMTADGLRHSLQRTFTDSAVLTDILVLGMQGEPLAHTSSDHPQSAHQHDSQGLRHYALDAGDTRPHIGPPIFGPAQKRWLLPVSVPVRSYDGKLEGVITGLLDLDYFQRFYARLGTRRHWQYTITDLQGRIVTHFPMLTPVNADTRFLPDTAALLRGTGIQSFDATNPLNGKPFLYTARMFGNQPLIMFVGFDAEQNLAQWRQHTAEKVAMLLLLAAVLLSAAFLLLRALTKSAHDSELVSAVLRAAGDTIFISRDGRILACNPAAVRTYAAQSEADLVGHEPREFWAERQPDGQLSVESAKLNYSAAAARDGHHFEWVSRRLDGSTFTNEVNLTAFSVDGATYYLSIARDITERKHSETQILQLNHELEDRVASRTEQLASAKRELEVANDELRAFSYTVAHDMRAPVRHVLGFADMALSGENAAAIPAEVRLCVERIISATKRMSEMIESLLQLGRVGQKPLAETEVDLALLATSVVNGLRERHPERQVDVRIEPNLRVKADPTLMHMVLENLLANAWKFTGKKEHAKIEVGRGQDDAGHYFYVRDNGAGYDPRYATRLFEPFSRMHTREQFDGNGVGLATVRRILGRHGGTIRAEAEVDQGATFFFYLGTRDARFYGQDGQGSASA